MLHTKHAALAIRLIKGYQPPQPMHLYLKQYFKANKKHGSKDRRAIANYVYACLRSGNQELLLSEDALHDYTQKIFQLNQIYKFESNKISFDVEQFYLYKSQIKTLPDVLSQITLSSNLDKHTFFSKLQIKPYTFVRSSVKVLSVSDKSIPFVQLQQNCFAFEADVKLQEVFSSVEQYVVQDYNSQLICNAIHVTPQMEIWDACCASGGKSLALLQRQTGLKITASDVRKNMLQQYQQRLAIYGKAAMHLFDADAQDKQALAAQLNGKTFDTIICDVPCSGSGTWARTPEQLFFANTRLILNFSQLQFNIANNCLQYLKPQGNLYYITCSAFKHENEDVVQKLLEYNSSIKLISQKLYSGLEYNCDFLFIAQLHMQG